MIVKAVGGATAGIRLEAAAGETDRSKVYVARPRIYTSLGLGIRRAVSAGGGGLRYWPVGDALHQHKIISGSSPPAIL